MASILMKSGMYRVEERGLIDVKSKGFMKTYFLLGTTDTNHNASDARIQSLITSTKSIIANLASNGKMGLLSSFASWSDFNSIISASPIASRSSANLPFLFCSNSTSNSSSSSSGSRNSIAISSYTFLIVDDSLVIRKKHQRILMNLYPTSTIVIANDGIIACSVLEKVGYDNVHAILVDQDMPQMNGTDFIIYAKEGGYKGCIIGIIGDIANDKSLRTTADNYVAAVLIKPLVAESIYAVLSKNNIR